MSATKSTSCGTAWRMDNCMELTGSFLLRRYPLLRALLASLIMLASKSEIRFFLVFVRPQPEIVTKPWILRFEFGQLKTLPELPGALHEFFLWQGNRRVAPLACRIDEHRRGAVHFRQRVIKFLPPSARRWTRLSSVLSNN